MLMKLGIPTDMENMCRRVDKHVAVFMAGVTTPLSAGFLPSVQSAAFALRNILREGETSFYEGKGRTYDQDDVAARIIERGAVAKAVAYLESGDPVLKEAGRFLVEGVAQIAPTAAQKVPYLVVEMPSAPNRDALAQTACLWPLQVQLDP